MKVNIKYFDFEQKSPEWFEIRKLKMTASHAQAIGNCGKGLETYIREIMSEYYSSGDKKYFASRHTERGNELEPTARAIYEMERGATVREVGFVQYSEYVGASPDGLVDDDPEGEGGTEIKCIDDGVYFDHMLDGANAIESKYEWQCQMNLLITGRKWWDLIYYNPNYAKTIFVYRIYPDKEKFAKLLKGFAMGETLINQIKLKVEKINK